MTSVCVMLLISNLWSLKNYIQDTVFMVRLVDHGFETIMYNPLDYHQQIYETSTSWCIFVATSAVRLLILKQFEADITRGNKFNMRLSGIQYQRKESRRTSLFGAMRPLNTISSLLFCITIGMMILYYNLHVQLPNYWLYRESFDEYPDLYADPSDIIDDEYQYNNYLEDRDEYIDWNNDIGSYGTLQCDNLSCHVQPSLWQYLSQGHVKERNCLQVLWCPSGYYCGPLPPEILYAYGKWEHDTTMNPADCDFPHITVSPNYQM